MKFIRLISFLLFGVLFIRLMNSLLLLFSISILEFVIILLRLEISSEEMCGIFDLMYFLLVLWICVYLMLWLKMCNL